ncbi:hypothetical protein FNU76_03235 [Chitinimonas arctica]|uniref:Leucine-rich repeat domain-containing protein n=1 Tax=Chitinimonas arctica TaxID=2594795 RepID=A0A516SBK5_9NEIS|nr:hypothetical protein [Chitinimonas arctica]QDQ25448.1 hypothetical protein FNU76_03235 [Chitinimonas arctica]
MENIAIRTASINSTTELDHLHDAPAEAQLRDIIARIESNDETLTEVSIAGTFMISVKNIEQLGAKLSKNNIVHTLRLTDCNFDSEYLWAFFLELSENKTIKNLDFSENPDLGTHGMRALEERLSKRGSPCLNSLALRECEITPSHIGKLHHCMQVKHLDLGLNLLSDPGVEVLAGSKSGLLESLNLDCNDISDASIHALITLAEKTPSLIKISLRGNPGISHAQMAELTAVLERNSASGPRKRARSDQTDYNLEHKLFKFGLNNVRARSATERQQAHIRREELNDNT